MLSFLKVFSLTCLLVLSSCIARSQEYRHFYMHLQKLHRSWETMQEEDCFLIILVDAHHLDYTKESQFFQSVAKHPNDGSKNRDVGHAWIYLQSKKDGTIFTLEGGHSGERDDVPTRYFDGIINYNEWGYANPTIDEILNPRDEPNPIKYLWTVREDGFFQKGSGGHRPTFAAKISLTPQQFEQILNFIRPRHYPYRYYALLGSQCSTFVTQIATLAGLSLNSQLTMQVAPYFCYERIWIRLWEDPRYSVITFATPDVIEKSLIEAVEKGQAEYALDWYLKHSQKS